MSAARGSVLPRTRALLALIAVLIVWGGTYAITKDTLERIPPLTLATLRYFAAALALLPFALVRGGLAALPRPIPWRTLAWMSLCGIALYSTAFNYALVHATASQGALIQALSPAAIAASAFFFLHEHLSLRRSLGIVLSVLGVALVVSVAPTQTEARHPFLGAALMALTVFAWSGYTVFAKRLARADEVVVAACVASLGALMMVPGMVLELWHRPFPAIAPSGWLAILYLGAVCSALGYVVYSYALRHRDASEVGTWTNLVPIVGVGTSVAFLGETLLLLQLLGGALALVGMWQSRS